MTPKAYAVKSSNGSSMGRGTLDIQYDHDRTGAARVATVGARPRLGWVSPWLFGAREDPGRWDPTAPGTEFAAPHRRQHRNHDMRPSGDSLKDGDAPVTQLLLLAKDGDEDALQRLLPMILDEMRQLAHRCLAGQPRDQLLQTTMLVNEAYVRLFHGQLSDWQDRQHFFAIVAKAMRSVVIDFARSRRRDKRMPRGEKLPLDQLADRLEAFSPEVDTFNHALDLLERRDPKLARLAELRFFVGLTEAEAAEILQTPLRTLQREWEFACKWLRVKMREDRD